MNRNRIAYALIVALAGTAALAGCKKREEPVATPPVATTPTPPPTPMETTPAGVTVSAVSVGNQAGADRFVNPVLNFSPSDHIIVSIRTDGAASNVDLGARLTYQDGQVAGEQNATLNTTGAETTNIDFTKATPWPAGKYKAEVTINGQPAGTAQEFEVK